MQQFCLENAAIKNSIKTPLLGHAWEKLRLQSQPAGRTVNSDVKTWKKYIQNSGTMLISSFADDRVMGIRGMGALGTADAKNAIITMLDDDILEVRLVAAEQLGKLNDNLGEPEVQDVFHKNLTADFDEEERQFSIYTTLH